MIRYILLLLTGIFQLDIASGQHRDSVINFAKSEVRDSIYREPARYDTFTWTIVDTFEIKSIDVKLFRFNEDGVLKFFVMYNVKNRNFTLLPCNEQSGNFRGFSVDFLNSENGGFDMRGIEDYLDKNFPLDTSAKFLAGLDSLFRYYLCSGYYDSSAYRRVLKGKQVVLVLDNLEKNCSIVQSIKAVPILRNEFKMNTMFFKRFLLMRLTDPLCFIYNVGDCGFYVFNVTYRGYKNSSSDWMSKYDPVRNFKNNYRIQFYSF